MKTERQKQETETRKETTAGYRDIKLGNEETLIYSEPLERLQGSMIGNAISIFLIIGFPIYSIIGFTGLTSYIEEKSFAAFSSEIESLRTALGVVLLCSFGLALALRKGRDWMQPEGSKFVITNKRLFNWSPSYTLPIVYECDYSDVLYIYPETLGKQDFLNVRYLGYDRETEQEVEKIHRFEVKDANKAYLQIPETLRAECGYSGPKAKTYNAKKSAEDFWGLGLGIFTLIFIAVIAISTYTQMTSNHALEEGRAAFKRGDLAKAEEQLKLAYDRMKHPPFDGNRGPTAYRYAQALMANGKTNLAIAKFEEAAAKCNWEDSDSGVNWKPAVFRSYVALAEIHLQRRIFSTAQEYFERAFNVMNLETNEKQTRQFLLEYSGFLMMQGDQTKAELIQYMGAAFTASKSRNLPD